MSTRAPPEKPRSDECTTAWLILCGAHDAAWSFLQTYEEGRKKRKARGASTDEEQNLLRAMLLFAAAGLDSLFKQLIRDALPAVLGRDEGARAMLSTFAHRRLKKDDELDHKFLAELVTAMQPQARLIEELKRELTSGSLQSTEEVFKAAAYFNIKSDRITEDPAQLTSIFRARNQIAHEMDVDFGQPNRNRRQRKKREMIDFTSELLRVGDALLSEVDAILAGECPQFTLSTSGTTRKAKKKGKRRTKGRTSG